MKKTLLCTLILTLCLTLFGCNSDPISKMMNNWCDTVAVHASKQDFASYKEITVTGIFGGEIINMTYEMEYIDDRGVTQLINDEGASLEAKTIISSILSEYCMMTATFANEYA